MLTPALKLDNYWAVILCGTTLIPLTVMGAQAGIAQGTARWGSLTAIYLGNGIGRLTGGTIAMIISPTTTSAMIGIAVGSWPRVAGARLILGHLQGGPRSAAAPCFARRCCRRTPCSRTSR